MCAADGFCYFFFFNDTATTEIYTLSLHDALPIWEFPIWTSRLCASYASHAIGTTEFITRAGSSQVTEFRRLVFAVCRVLLKRASFIPSWGQFACACEQEAATRGWRDGELHWKALK